MTYFTREELDDIANSLISEPTRENLQKINDRYNSNNIISANITNNEDSSGPSSSEITSNPEVPIQEPIVVSIPNTEPVVEEPLQTSTTTTNSGIEVPTLSTPNENVSVEVNNMPNQGTIEPVTPESNIYSENIQPVELPNIELNTSNVPLGAPEVPTLSPPNENVSVEANNMPNQGTIEPVTPELNTYSENIQPVELPNTELNTSNIPLGAPEVPTLSAPNENVSVEVNNIPNLNTVNTAEAVTPPLNTFASTPNTNNSAVPFDGNLFAQPNTNPSAMMETTDNFGVNEMQGTNVPIENNNFFGPNVNSSPVNNPIPITEPQPQPEIIGPTMFGQIQNDYQKVA